MRSLEPDRRPAGTRFSMEREECAAIPFPERRHCLSVMSHLFRRASFRLLLAFATLIALGTVVLAFSIEGHGADRSVVMDALFTATSAVCVTGLTVVDPGTELSPPGQVALLVLIQLGGLGILTLSNWILLTLGPRKLRPAGRLVLERTHGQLPGVHPVWLLRNIVLFTLFWESLGTLLLFLRFSADFPSTGKALWCALFHSISAFCNAGFSLFPDSLVRYRGDAFVNGTILGLILVGGLGFIVFTDAFHALLSRTRRSLTLHSRVVLVTTCALVSIGFVGFFVFEWSNPLEDFDLRERLLSSFFLSITSRTAGFNTLDTGNLCNASLLLLVLLMMVGASPGSTGGGIKTTTAALLWAMILSRLRNRPRVELLGRSIPTNLVSKALALSLLWVAIVAAGTLLLEMLEVGGLPHPETRGRFLEHLFEVSSATGTVGLSTGITSSLTQGSRIVLIVCMFVGRLGPLLVAESLIGTRRAVPYQLPEERIVVG